MPDSCSRVSRQVDDQAQSLNIFFRGTSEGLKFTNTHGVWGSRQLLLAHARGDKWRNQRFLLSNLVQPTSGMSQVIRPLPGTSAPTMNSVTLVPQSQPIMNTVSSMQPDAWGGVGAAIAPPHYVLHRSSADVICELPMRVNKIPKSYIKMKKKC